MNDIFVAVGSNIDPQENIPKAFELLKKRVDILKVSDHFITSPVKEGRGEDFINGVWQIGTQIEPEKLKYEILRGVESRLGRLRGNDSHAPRTIDLDLILYGDRVIEKEHFVLPDSDILKRNFIAFPLYQLCENLVIPGYNRSLKRIISDLDFSGMDHCREVTVILKRRLEDES